MIASFKLYSYFSFQILNFVVPLYAFFMKCSLMLNFISISYIWSFYFRTAPLLREFNNTTLLEREFAGSPLITVEIANYLKQPTSKDCDYLDNFPTIKKLYLKYNCISCNEADVERIFSIAGTFICGVKVMGILELECLL